MRAHQSRLVTGWRRLRPAGPLRAPGGVPGPPGDVLAHLSATWWPDGPAAQVVTGPASLQAPRGQRFLPLPPGRPRVLVPLETPRAAAGTLVANLPMRRRRDRVVRRSLALLVRSGVGQRVWQDHHVGLVLAGDEAPTLLESLREHWRRDVHALGLTVRRVTPNYKPTFIAVDASGAVLGYGKLASTTGTADRLQREADGLRWAAKHPIRGLRTPEVLASFIWGAGSVMVVSPLPGRSVRYPVDGRAPGHLLEGAEEGREAAGRVAERLAARVRAVGDDDLVDAVDHFVDRFERRHGDLELPVGRIHGDWVPWNMACHGDDTWVFDWEHTEPRSALPLDIVHWHLLVGRDRYGQRLEHALARADDAAVLDLAHYGFDPDARGAVLALSRLHLAARSAELFGDTGLWLADERRVLIDELRGDR